MKLEGQLHDPPYGHEHRVPHIQLLEQNDEGEWEETEETLYINETLYNNIYDMKTIIKRYEQDILVVVDGGEGSGKSTLGRQLGKVFYNKLSNDNLSYNAGQFIQKCFDHPDWSCEILDESKEDLDRKSTMSRNNKKFMSFLSQSRVLHKIMIIILPSIYDLDKYVAQHRAKMLIHCYKHKGIYPGYFSFYGEEGINKLFKYCHKDRTYNVKPAFSGRFSNQQVIDLSEYNKRKMAAIEKFRKYAEQEPVTKDEVIKEYILQRVKALQSDPKCLPQKELAEIFGFTRQTIFHNWANNES